MTSVLLGSTKETRTRDLNRDNPIQASWLRRKRRLRPRGHADYQITGSVASPHGFYSWQQKPAEV